VIKPNFFIVGAPKCGTSALYQYLKAHPDICMSKVKEPHYFAQEFQVLKLSMYRSLEAYLSLFEDVHNEKCIGEASVFYLYSKDAAYKIREFNPDAKIIAILRNPVDMLYSLFYQARFSGNEILKTFEEALAAEENRKRGLGIPPRSMGKKLYYREVGQYSGQLQRYFDCFGRENVHVIIFDDFQKDTPLVYRDLLQFLNVDADFQVDFNVVNANKVVRIQALNRLTGSYSPPWYTKFCSSVLYRIPPQIRIKITAPIKAWNTKAGLRPPMNPGTLRQLQQEFRPEIEKLSVLLDRDLTCWYA
jgi:hypothetical protein